MSLTGAWRRGRTLAGRTPNPNLGDGVDRRHLTPVEPDPAVPAPEHGLPVVPTVLYAADDYMLPVGRVQLDQAVPMDRTPESHDGGAARGAELAAHEVDQGGAGRAHYFTPGVTREADASYRTERTEMALAVSQSRGQVTQGIDRDGPSPQGTYTMRWIDRRVTRRTITPDSYPLYGYRAATAKQSPAPAAGQGNQYTSPWRKLGGVHLNKIVTPEIRRQPPAYMDEATIGDAPAAVSAGFWEL